MREPAKVSISPKAASTLASMMPVGGTLKETKTRSTPMLTTANARSIWWWVFVSAVFLLGSLVILMRALVLLDVSVARVGAATL